ncbi:MAG: hypothetical protein ACP5T9_03120 [Thermoplasmata archaeon]
MNKSMFIDNLTRRMPVCPHCHRKINYLIVRMRFYEYHRVIIDKGRVRTEIESAEDLLEDPYYRVYFCPKCKARLDLTDDEVEDFLHGTYPKRWAVKEGTTKGEVL